MQTLFRGGACAVVMALVMAVGVAGDRARARTARRTELARLRGELDESRLRSHEAQP